MVILPHALPSLLKIHSKANLSDNEILKMIVSINQGLRILEPNSEEIHKNQKEVIEIRDSSTAAIEYGRLIVDFSALISSQSLVGLGEILRSDRLYLEGNNISSLDVTTNPSILYLDMLDNLSLRLERIEEWLEMD